MKEPVTCKLALPKREGRKVDTQERCHNIDLPSVGMTYEIYSNAKVT